jgi:hypothetical protein
VFEVTDDSGFLAVVVPATYEGFVESNWQFSQLLAHFRTQMSRQSLLIWGTGLAGIWKVEVPLRASRRKGFREVSGPLQVTGGCVLLTNYESLTMAAQFEDVRLPEPHQKNLLLDVPDGEYRCRVIQMFDPSTARVIGSGKPDFVVEIARSGSLPAVWVEIPWFTE